MSNETPTPRTDAVRNEVRQGYTNHSIEAELLVDLTNLARQLERELAEANARIETYRTEWRKQPDYEKERASVAQKLCVLIKERDAARAELELCKTCREAEKEDLCELTRRLKNIAVYDITEEHPAYLKLNALTKELLGVEVHLCEARMPSTYGKGAVQRLKEVEGVLAIAESELKNARDEAQKWRECATLYRQMFYNGDDNDTRNRSDNLFKDLCPSPTPSSPPSQEAVLLRCCYCGIQPETIAVTPSGKPFCSEECRKQYHAQYGLPATDIDPASNAAASPTASRLAEHESKLELLLHRTEFLLALFSECRDSRFWLFKTVWPADLTLPTKQDAKIP